MKQMSYVTRWLYSTSHKDIGILYLGFGMLSAMIGTGMSVIIRMELSNGNSQFFHGNNQAFNVIISGHALLMIFFFIMPVWMGAFGNFFLPILIGAADMAFARLNNISFWCLPPALVCIVCSVLIEQGAGTGFKDKINYLYNNRVAGLKPIGGHSLLFIIFNIYYSLFNFKNIKKYHNNSFKENLNDLDFWYYLTGLIEGDGSIKIPKNRISNNNILRYPTISIIFNLKDKPLAIKIQEKLGFGTISNNLKRENSCVLNFYSQKDIIYILNNINGKMRTKKINKLWDLIDWYKNYTLTKVYTNINIFNLEKLPLDTSNLNNNAWLAGFIEADGNFYINLENNKNLKTYFRLSQKKDDNMLYNIMLEISKIFNINLLENNRNRILFRNNIKYKYIEKNYLFNIRSVDSSLMLINYLNKYPIYSSKYLDYKDWEKFLNIKINKIKFDNNLDKEYVLLKNNMNNNRKLFNWNHLNNFYK